MTRRDIVIRGVTPLQISQMASSIRGMILTELNIDWDAEGEKGQGDLRYVVQQATERHPRGEQFQAADILEALKQADEDFYNEVCELLFVAFPW